MYSLNILIIFLTPVKYAENILYVPLFCFSDISFNLWFRGQSYRLQIERSLVRFPTLPELLRDNWPGTGSTQPPEDN
jgi:hypothetical protein